MSSSRLKRLNHHGNGHEKWWITVGSEVPKEALRRSSELFRPIHHRSHKSDIFRIFSGSREKSVSNLFGSFGRTRKWNFPSDKRSWRRFSILLPTSPFIVCVHKLALKYTANYDARKLKGKEAMMFEDEIGENKSHAEIELYAPLCCALHVHKCVSL